MKRTTKTLQTTKNPKVSDKKLFWTSVTFVALFAIVGGSIYLSASRAENLPDEYTYDNRIQSLSFTSAPSDLRAEILSVAKKEVPNCVKGDSLLDYYSQPTNPQVTYTSEEGGFATTYIDCKNTSELLLAKTDEGWHKVASTSLEYKCDDLTASKVPVWFLQAQLPTDDTASAAEQYDPTVTCIPSTPGARTSAVYDYGE